MKTLHMLQALDKQQRRSELCLPRYQDPGRMTFHDFAKFGGPSYPRLPRVDPSDDHQRTAYLSGSIVP